MKALARPDAAFLADSAERIRALGRRVIADVIKSVIEIGRLLVECRDHPDMKHGGWLPWLKREFGWSDQQARRFIHVYELSREGKFNNLLNLDLPISALYLLAAPSTPESARTEVIERASVGERLRIDEVRAIIADHDKRAILAAASQIRAEQADSRRAERDLRLIEISKGNTGLPEDRRYPIILADPPWQFSAFVNDTRIRAPELHYQTMPLQEICDLQIGEKIATPDAMLFMWVPPALLFEYGKPVLDAWGFQHRGDFVWVKDGQLSETERRFSLGLYCRNQHEHLLIATRGERLHPDPSNLSPSTIYAPRREHSRKPDEVHEIIERMYPELPKIELFARKARPGWRVWGNEVPPPDPGETWDAMWGRPFDYTKLDGGAP
jgi:N6-adenosine-specific RNA methylase IME4